MDAYRKLQLRPSIQPARRQLNNFDGSRIAVKGTVMIPVSFKGHRVEAHTFYVVQRGTSLLGLDLFRALGFEVREPNELSAVNQIASSSSNDPKQKLFDAFPPLKTSPSCSTTTLASPSRASLTTRASTEVSYRSYKSSVAFRSRYSTRLKPRSTAWCATAFSKQCTHRSGSATSSLPVNQTALYASAQTLRRQQSDHRRPVSTTDNRRAQSILRWSSVLQ